MEQRHREIIRHALGLQPPQHVRPYRRHFVTGPGSSDWNDCRTLTDQGMMKDYGDRGGMYGGDHLFLVTEAGAQAVGHQLPTD
jgi:hypothetical protein